MGVIFHILLTGEAVFPGKKFNDVLRKNKACKIDYSQEIYKLITPESLDLLKNMLDPNP